MVAMGTIWPTNPELFTLCPLMGKSSPTLLWNHEGPAVRTPHLEAGGVKQGDPSPMCTGFANITILDMFVISFKCLPS